MVTMSENLLQTLQQLVQDVIAPDVRELKVRVSSLEKQMDVRFDAVDVRFDAVDMRFNALEQKMDARFAALEQKSGSVRGNHGGHRRIKGAVGTYDHAIDYTSG